MSKPVLISFDFDGVIADTISALKDVFALFLRDYNIPYSDELFEKYNGTSIPRVIEDLKSQYSFASNSKELLSDYQNRVRVVSEKIPATKGILNTIKSLKEHGYTLTVSSSGSKEYIEGFLKKNCLIEFFDEIFSSESFIYSKPDPKYYQSIISKYKGFDVFVIEDSDNGLVSSFNAGAQTVFFNENDRISTVPYHYEISDPDQILDIIEKQHREGFFISSSNIDVVIRKTQPVFTEEEKKQIEEIWRARPEHVFNGSVLAFDRMCYNDDRLIVECYLTEYKYVYSIRSRITPMAVSGISVDPQGRSIVSVRNRVTDYSGCYELVPSGGIDKTYVENSAQGYKDQLIAEFCEEVGSSVSKEEVLDINTLGLCYDAKSNTMDICMKIQYGKPFSKKRICGDNEEYTGQSTLIDDIESIKRLIADKEVVITSRMILDYM